MGMPAYEKLEEPEAPGRPIVLVVDDVVLVRMLVADSLRMRGFHIVEAGSGEEAIGLLQSGMRISVVLTDIYMPAAELDGLGLARWISNHRPEIRVVVGSGVSASLDPADVPLFAGPVIPKPYNWDTVEQRLRAAIGQAGGQTGGQPG
jgi:CheY-like chemotaxis protein